MKYLNALQKKKTNHEKITALTAYDTVSARILDESGIDVILVGDTCGMVRLGYDNTIPVTMDEMLIITKAVSRGITNSILVADMPFLSYHISEKDSIKNAGIFLKETKSQAVKIESHENNINVVQALIKSEIPVIGHIGLTPQSIYRLGGYKVQGRSAEETDKLLSLAHKLEDCGVSAIVLELMTSECAQCITESLTIPTIGIGAGPHCDGQILVLDDMLGLFPDFVPRHVKQYASLYNQMKEAVTKYKRDVEKISFPEGDHYTTMETGEHEAINRIKNHYATDEKSRKE